MKHPYLNWDRYYHEYHEEWQWKVVLRKHWAGSVSRSVLRRETLCVICGDRVYDTCVTVNVICSSKPLTAASRYSRGPIAFEYLAWDVER